MALDGAKLSILKERQASRLAETRTIYVEPWEEEVELRRLKLDDLIRSEQGAYEIDDSGNKQYSEELRKAILVLLGVVGLHPLRDKEFIMQEPAGVINDICKEILDFSGFNSTVDNISTKKKD